MSWEPLCATDPLPGDPSVLESVAEQVRQVANAIETARSRAGVDQPLLHAEWTGRSAIQAADGLTTLGPAFRFVTDALHEASRAARSSSAVLRDGQAEARNLRAHAYWLGEQIARLEYSDAIDDCVGHRLNDARNELIALRHRLWELVARVARVEAGAAAALASIPSAYWGPVRGRAAAGSTIAEYANLWFETRGGTLLWTLEPMSPTDQLARWNSLTRDEREVLITRYPAQVTAMRGLPQSDRDRAELILLDVIGNGVPVVVDSLSAEARLSLKVWSFGVHGSATMTQTADGKVSVALEGGADIGIGRRFDEGEASGSVEVRVGAQGRAVYDFRSIDSATAFIGALTSALPSPDAVKQVASNPRRFGGSHSDTIYTVKDQAVASAKLGSLVEAEAAIGTIVEYSPTTGIMALSTTFALDALVTLPTHRGGQVITGNVDVAAALTQTIGPAGAATSARVEVTAGREPGSVSGWLRKPESTSP